MNMHINIFALRILSRWICYNRTLQTFIYILYNILNIFFNSSFGFCATWLGLFYTSKVDSWQTKRFSAEKNVSYVVEKRCSCVYLLYVLASTFISRKRNMWRVMMMHHIFYSSQRETWTTAYFEIGNSHSGSNSILHTF